MIGTDVHIRAYKIQERSEIQMKKVYCFDLATEYKSAKDASRKTGVDRTSIVKACNLHRLTAGGMLWCYLEDKEAKVWRV